MANTHNLESWIWAFWMGTSRQPALNPYRAHWREYGHQQEMPKRPTCSVSLQTPFGRFLKTSAGSSAHQPLTSLSGCQPESGARLIHLRTHDLDEFLSGTMSASLLSIARLRRARVAFCNQPLLGRGGAAVTIHPPPQSPPKPVPKNLPKPWPPPKCYLDMSKLRRSLAASRGVGRR